MLIILLWFTPVNRIYTEEWLTGKTCEEGYTYNPPEPIFKIPNDFRYYVPSFSEHSDFRTYIESFPEIDSPEVFGLHPNADLTFRVKEATSLFQTLGETQPKGGGSDGDISREDILYDKSTELLDRLPQDYVEDEYKAKIRKLGGMAVPMNIYHFYSVSDRLHICWTHFFGVSKKLFTCKYTTIHAHASY